jgi:hypothetical protein
MKAVMSVLALGITVAIASPVTAQTSPFAVASCEADVTQIGKVHVPEAVLANGQPLASGDYEMRVTSEHPAPVVGQSATGECWVEFVKGGAVVAREVASVIPDSAMADVAKGPGPRPNTVRVDALKGGEYLRIWFNVNATNYLVHLPVATARER